MSTPPPTIDETEPSRAKVVLALVLIMLAAVLVRARYAPLDAPLDREFDGFQAGFFGISLVNYERLGLGAMHGYPVANVDALPGEPASWYPYANHSPVLPLGLSLWMRATGPQGWGTAWQSGAPPTNGPPGAFEAALRTPSYLASLLTILALYWALRAALKARPALLATLLYAAFPLAIHQAGLVNYEPFATLFIVLTFGAGLRYLNRRAALWPVCLFALLGTSITYAPLFATLPLTIVLFLVSRAHDQGQGEQPDPLLRRLCASVAVGLAALAPALAHGYWANRALASHAPTESASLGDRVSVLFAPLTDGSIPLGTWLRHQVTELSLATSPLFLELALLALVIAALDALAKPGGRRALGGFGASLLLFTSGVTVLFFYYKHTADGILPGSSSQNTFQLGVLPGAAALAGYSLDEIRTTLARVFKSREPGATPLRRFGPAAIVAVVVAVLFSTFAQRLDHKYALDRGPQPGRPLPVVIGAELNAALPPRAIGLYPLSMGLTPAVSLYAWHTLFPVTSDIATVQAFEATLDGHGLRGVPLYLCLPIEPAPGTEAGVDGVEELFRKLRPTVAATEPTLTEHWRLWRIN